MYTKRVIEITIIFFFAYVNKKKKNFFHLEQ